MNANEAPEKIYLEAIYPNNGVLPNGLNYTPSPTDIEYTRTDVFIEKACEYWYQYNRDIIKGHSENHILGRGAFTVNVEDFKRYLKGE